MSSVLSVGRHTLTNATIHVSRLQPQPPPSLIFNEPVDETRLLAKKLPPGCSRDELQTFLGRACAPRIHCWRIGVKPTTALLDFVRAPGTVYPWSLHVTTDSALNEMYELSRCMCHAARSSSDHSCIWKCKLFLTSWKFILHCVSKKKQYTWLLIITLANADRFLKFFHCQILKETLYVTVAVPSTSLSLCCYITLWNSKILYNGWTFTHTIVTSHRSVTDDRRRWQMPTDDDRHQRPLLVWSLHHV